MTKKHAKFKTQPLFRKEKDLISLLKQKDGLDKIQAFVESAENLKKQSEHIEAKDLLDWQVKCISMLPKEHKDNKELITEFSSLVAKYEVDSKE